MIDIIIYLTEIEEFYSLNKSGSVMVQNPTVSGTPHRDEVKEPCIYPMMKNLLLSYPGMSYFFH